jgi:hypothetical protein
MSLYAAIAPRVELAVLPRAEGAVIATGDVGVFPLPCKIFPNEIATQVNIARYTI